MNVIDLNHNLKCVYANCSKHFDGARGGWYQPGDWSLPTWWTAGVPARGKTLTDAAAVDKMHAAMGVDRFTLPEVD